jgi:hypothetical protein
MNQNPNDKFEADLKQVEEILDRTKANLMDLLPEFESLEAAMAGKNAAVVATAPGPAENAPAIPRSHFGWFHFSSHKSR